jgi:addiction module RelB/DinJ family antitoxin
MNTATITFRVAPETKRRARALFSRLGVSTSDAMNRLLAQSLACGALPSALPPGETRSDEEEADETPNARVAATLQRVLDGTEPTYGPFASVEEMLDFAESMAD